jgi:hypothetical protein
VQTSTLKTIGVAKKQNDLFFPLDLDDNSLYASYTDLASSFFKHGMHIDVSDSALLWHHKLGHVSNNVLK